MATAYNRLQTTKKDNGCKPLPFYSLMKITLKLAVSFSELGCIFIISYLFRSVKQKNGRYSPIEPYLPINIIFYIYCHNSSCGAAITVFPVSNP